ncbi:MAG: alpha/beta hydrolase, partial [Steroidobacteraceae bacterium]
METHRIAVDGSQSIVLDWFPATVDARVALFVHGLGSHRRGEKASYFAERFNARGWTYAAVDLRGHGE